MSSGTSSEILVHGDPSKLAQRVTLQNWDVRPSAMLRSAYY